MFQGVTYGKKSFVSIILKTGQPADDNWTAVVVKTENRQIWFLVRTMVSLGE